MSVRAGKYGLLLIGILWSFSIVLIAGERNLHFDQLTTRNGLSSNTVNTILQDSRGFLWFGTETGLNRYDGYRFKVFQNNRNDSSTISNNYIWSIAEDSEGFLWIGTDGGGVNRFDPRTETFVRFQNDAGDTASLGSDIAQSVLVDSKGNVWVGTWDGGVNLLPKGTGSFMRFVNIPGDPASLSNNKVHFVKEDREGNIWIGTDGGGLERYDPELKRFIHHKHDPRDPRTISLDMVTDMVEDAQGNLWVTTYGEGLNLFNKETGKWSRFKLTGPGVKPASNVFWKIAQDGKGFLWITIQTEGLVMFDPAAKNFTRIMERKNDRGGLPTNLLQDVMEDNTGVLWIGTVGKGAVKTDRKPAMFTTVQNIPGDRNSLPPEFVYSIVEDVNGDILAGTLASGVVRLGKDLRVKKRYAVNTPGGLAGEYARSMYRDSRNDIWVGTYFGKLNKLNRRTDSFMQYDLDFLKTNIMRNWVRTVTEDSAGNLWFGSHGSGGVTALDRKTGQWSSYVPSDTSILSLSGYDVLSIREDRRGYLWVGTQSYGLTRIDRSAGSVKKYFHEAGNPRSIPDNSVPELFVDTRGNVWIGTTSSGLARYDYDTDSFDVYTTEEGLSGNSICGILEDADGNLWISTMNAITRFDPITKTCDTYDYFDGIRSEEFIFSSRCRTADGRMLFGGTDGITVFHPDSVRERIDHAPMVLTSFKIFNKEVKLPRAVSYLDTIHLDYTDNFFSFEFASLDYTMPERTEYSYIFEGVDNGWIDAGRVSFANYTHVDPGNYTFRVRTSDGGNSAVVVVVIKPPFWMTVWFRAILTVGFLSIGPMFYFRRVSQLKKEKKRQEEFSRQLINSQEEERKRIASELHDSIGQNLLFIKNSASLGEKKNDVLRYADIGRTALSSIEEVRRIAFNLYPYQLDRMGLTGAIESVVRTIGETSGIRFRSHIRNVDGVMDKERESSIFRIVQECLNNVVKHSGADQATVSIQQENDMLTIVIGDNGRGFEMEKMMLERGGFGLKNIHHRVVLLRGSVRYTASDEWKTLITITLPVGR